MECRTGCGACCIAPSITVPLPGMPAGKPAGVPCVNLGPLSRGCTVWEQAGYPAPCRLFRPSAENCGDSAAQALIILTELERATDPHA